MMGRKRLLGVMLATPTTASGLPAVEGDAERGKAKAQSRNACHGPQGQGRGPNPNIAHMSKEAFIQALKEYKDRTRQNAMMQAMTANMSEQEMADLAAYYTPASE